MIVLTPEIDGVASYPAHSRSVTRFKQVLREAMTSPSAFARLPSRALEIIRQRQCLQAVHPLVEAVHAGWDLSAPADALSQLPKSNEIVMVDEWLKSDDSISVQQIRHPILKCVHERARCLAYLPDELDNLIRSAEPKKLDTSTPGTVCYVTHVDYPYARNGYTRRSDSIVKAIQDHGIKVHRVCSRTYIQESIENPDPSLRILDRIEIAARRLAKEIPEDVSEVIAASDWTNGWVALLAARYRGLRFAYEVRGQWQLTQAALVPGYEHTRAFAARKELEKRLVQQSDSVFCQTITLAKYLGVEKTSHIVPNGTILDIEMSSTRPTNQGVLSLGYVGSVLGYEGLDMAIRAVVNLQNIYPNLSLTVIGDGPARRGLKRLCGELGAKGFIHILGAVPQDAALKALREFDAMILPRQDCQVCHVVEPLKPLEALGAGKAVLATPLDVLIGFEGILRAASFRQTDFESLIERCLKDPELLRNTGEAGYRWVQSQRIWFELSKPMITWISKAAEPEH